MVSRYMAGQAIGTIIALALGPIMGASFTDASFDWYVACGCVQYSSQMLMIEQRRHWLYYIAAILTGVNFLLCLFIRESRPNKILIRKIAVIKKVTGASNVHTDNPEHTPNVRTFFRNSLSRPALLFFHEPLVVSSSFAADTQIIPCFNHSA